MGDPHAVPGFGQVDLDIEDDAAVPASPPSPPSPKLESSFGELDFDLGEAEPPLSPPSTSRVFNTEKNRPIRESVPSVHDESTRVVTGDALSLASRAPPPLSDDSNTRALGGVEAALLPFGELDVDAAGLAARPSHRPSGSGSSAPPGHAEVAAMRDLYAKGDTDGALALAVRLSESVAPPAGDHDHPDASVVVEFGEQSVDLEDPFGGLGAAPQGRAPASSREPSPPPTARRLLDAGPPPASPLTLTERHSVPRMRKPMAEVSKLKIDHRAGFLLAHVDGMHTLDEILDICAMPATEALELISTLKAMGVIELD